MIAKPFKGGRTSQGADKTIAYLLNERVKKGLALVLKGDAELTKRLIKEASQKQKWSWSSGVLSFSETLDDDTKREIIADFERVFFAGLSQEQFNILWVNHEDKGRTELHYIAPRLELTTQKSFNPYFVKRDFNKKDLWQEKINIEYGLSSHLDNLKAVKEFKAKWAKDKKSLLKQIDEKVIALIKSGDIDSRNDIIDYLRQSFELGNIDNKFLTIIADDGKKHRLKGAMYSKDFTDFKSLWKAREAKSRVTANGTPRDLKTLEKAINEIVEKQSYGNRKKFNLDKLKPKQNNTLGEVLSPMKIVLQPRQTPKKPKDEEKENERIRTAMDRVNAADEARARARLDRESERTRRIKRYADIHRRAERTDYQAITEATKQWAEQRGLREDFKRILQSITRGLREIEQGFNERNYAIIEVLKSKFKPDAGNSIVDDARARNKAGREKNKSQKATRLKKGD